MEPRYRPRRNPSTRYRYESASSGGSLHPGDGMVVSARMRNNIVVAILVIGLLVLLYAFFMGDDFRIHDFQVQNNQGVPAAQIIGASGLAGEHIWFVDLNAAASRIDELPGVDAAQITCTWRVGCVILVQPSPAIALWQNTTDPSKKVWSDRQGKVQKATDGMLAKLNISVEDGSSPAPGSVLDRSVNRALIELLLLQPKVNRYTYSAQYGLMFIDSHGWKVRIGVAEHDGAMNEKLAILKQLGDQLVVQKASPHVVDIRYVRAPYYEQ